MVLSIGTVLELYDFNLVREASAAPQPLAKLDPARLVARTGLCGKCSDVTSRPRVISWSVVLARTVFVPDVRMSNCSVPIQAL